MKERMLYIMGIDWQWIYQRPQIIAEKLAKDYQLTVLFPRNIMTKKFTIPILEGVEFRILWTLPYQEKNRFIGMLSKIVNATKLKDINKFKYVYVGYPLFGRYIPTNYQGKIIYDCMDNHEALYPDRLRVHRVIQQEKILIERCDLLFASARMLCEKMDKVAGYPKSVLLRNGVKINEIHKVEQSTVRDRYSLGYIGTISEWFDYALIQDSLHAIDNIDYYLVGPADRRVSNSRITYHGKVPHDKLYETIKMYDCLIMPFCINEIVKAVDPVKLYEYIAFGKCIVSIYYPEIERFKDFVYFYNDSNSYIDLIHWLMQEGFPPKYSAEQQKKFLQDNTWEKRYEVLQENIRVVEV